MDARRRRRLRWEQLFELAEAYLQVTRKGLAEMLGRDPSRIIPESGNPKLDLVVELARVLDWPVDDVVAYAWVEDDAGDEGSVDTAGSTFDELQASAREAAIGGQYVQAIRLARQAYEQASTSDERALACIREASAHDGLGRYTEALEAEHRGLQEQIESAQLRRVLESNIANTHYTLWELPEARSIARDLLHWYADQPPVELRDRTTEAYSHYVLGHTLRRMMIMQPESAKELAGAARSSLQAALDRYARLQDEFGDESYGGIANTCLGGLVEVETVLGKRHAVDALEALTAGLQSVVDPAACPPGDWLESYGWWCIFGCNISLRHLTDESRLQHYMGLFTTKADEIADRLNNWAIRERVFSMEFENCQRVVPNGGRVPFLVFEDEDVKSLVGTMGRFPRFRQTGWKLLQTARAVRA